MLLFLIFISILFFQVSLIVFGIYVLISPDNILDAQTAFVSLSVINLMNWSISFLPIAIAFGAQVCNNYVAFYRIVLTIKKTTNIIFRVVAT